MAAENTPRRAVYDVVDMTHEHIEDIASIARQADINELWSQCAMTLRDALRMSLELSTIARVGRADGVAGVAYGVVDRREHGGQIWMVGTTLIDRHQRGFLENSRREVDEFRQCYDRLWNYVDVRNRRAVRWLEWLGFTLHGPMAHGPFQRPFYFFDWLRQKPAASEVQRDCSAA